MAKRNYSFKQLQEIAKANGLELTKYREEGMTKPVYMLNGEVFTYRLLKCVLTHLDVK